MKEETQDMKDRFISRKAKASEKLSALSSAAFILILHYALIAKDLTVCVCLLISFLFFSFQECDHLSS